MSPIRALPDAVGRVPDCAPGLLPSLSRLVCRIVSAPCRIVGLHGGCIEASSIFSRVTSGRSSQPDSGLRGLDRHHPRLRPRRPGHQRGPAYSTRPMATKCRACGEPLSVFRRSDAECCSRARAQRSRRRQASYERMLERFFAECEFCGDLLPARQRPHARDCSDLCRSRAHRERHRS